MEIEAETGIPSLYDMTGVTGVTGVHTLQQLSGVFQQFRFARLMEAPVTCVTVRNEEDSEKILSGKVSLHIDDSIPFHFLNFEW